MTGFKHWLRSLIAAFSVGLLTLSCQVVFGDFKVGNRAKAGAGGETSGGGTSAMGGSNAQGGTGNTYTSAQLVVFPMSDLFTSDLGAQAKFYVSLAYKPKAPVTVPIASEKLTEGTVSPESLAFTTEDWNAPQMVTVTGVHDRDNVGNQAYTVAVGPASSDDTDFQGARAVVPITNIDNDSAGFFVTPTKGLVTTEAGGQAFFTVVLNSLPEAPVTITLKSSDDTIGTVAPASLIFTRENWSALQTVTVTGLDDDSAGDERSYQITVGPLTSADEAYAQLPSQTVEVKNLDNDQAGVTVVLGIPIDSGDSTRLRTSETGESATFTVVLNKEPSKDVTIALASNSNEGKVVPSSLTFTALNWAAPQTVTVIGEDNDSAADGNQPYQVTLGPITSEDTAYRALTSSGLPYVNVVNVDNDRAEISVTLLTGLDPTDPTALRTSEQGGVATFSIVLTSKPKFPVQFGLSSTMGDEGKISPSTLDFTVDNWNVAQKVTVTGVGDDEKDGNVVYAVRITAPTTEDPAYQKLPARDVKVVNLDDDVASIAPLKLLTGIDGGTKLITSEIGGSATFSVVLTSKPTTNVTVPVVSSNTNEGRVMPATLTFNTANYAMPQTVTVTGVQDPVTDGNQPYTVTVGPSTSMDPNYVGLSQSVKVTNTDEDSAYLVVNPVSASGITTEKGGTATFTIRLNSQPTVSVPVTVTSMKLSEGTVSPATLMFTGANYLTPQTVTVTGVDESIADGDQSYTVQVKGGGTDANYMYSATSLSLTNRDDDVVGMKLTAAANLTTTEVGGKATFTVALTSQPTGNVIITVSSSDTTEGTALPASLTFTSGNWANPQTVTVTGVEDAVADGNQTYTVSLKTANSSADSKYAQLAASTVSLVNTNDDNVGITVAPLTCTTTPGTTATFTVVLKSQPLGPVSIALSSDTPTAATIAPLTPLSFTTTNWNQAQTVTVTGVDDGSIDAMTPYKIVTAAAVSAMDPSYQGLNAADVACVNTTPPPPDPDPDPDP